MKIGVFICHCGSNIAGTVDCGKVAEIAKTYPDVAFSTDTMYTCSEPGQEEIVAAIKEHKLDGVVVASCTPRMHEPTFRRTVERAGLNKYMFEMANIREHVSWIGKDKEANTNKAAELVRIAVEKLRRDNPLFSKSFESTKRVLVIGGGDGGIRVGGLPVLFKAKGGGGDFKLDAGLHGAGSSGQECFQRGDAFRALRADKDAAKLKMGFAFHTGLMPLPAADTGDDEHQ